MLIMKRFTASVATTLKHPLVVWHLTEKSNQNYEYYVHLFPNVDFGNSLVNLEGTRCKSKTTLTKPPHSTPTYAVPKSTHMTPELFT